MGCCRDVCIYLNRGHDLVQTCKCKISLPSSWVCPECYCGCLYPWRPFHFICWFVKLFTCQCACVLAFLYRKNCLHWGNTRLCVKIRQAWLEQGNWEGGGGWKGCGLRWGARERAHRSEMGQPGRMRKDDKKRRMEEWEGAFQRWSRHRAAVCPEGKNGDLLFFLSDWFHSAYRFACEHSVWIKRYANGLQQHPYASSPWCILTHPPTPSPQPHPPHQSDKWHASHGAIVWH